MFWATLPADREVIEKRKQEERERRIKEAKEEIWLYLKGGRGVRYSSKYVVNPYEPKLKCIFTRDLRREKLFVYLNYLNGKKVFVRFSVEICNNRNDNPKRF